MLLTLQTHSDYLNKKFKEIISSHNISIFIELCLQNKEFIRKNYKKLVSYCFKCSFDDGFFFLLMKYKHSAALNEDFCSQYVRKLLADTTTAYELDEAIEAVKNKDDMRCFFRTAYYNTELLQEHKNELLLIACENDAMRHALFLLHVLKANINAYKGEIGMIMAQKKQVIWLRYFIQYGYDIEKYGEKIQQTLAQQEVKVSMQQLKSRLKRNQKTHEQKITRFTENTQQIFSALETEILEHLSSESNSLALMKELQRLKRLTQEIIKLEKQ